VKKLIAGFRINILRILSVLLLVGALAMEPVWIGSLWGRLMWDVGVVILFLGVLGRIWSILYIGGRKTREVVNDGPYSMCRHPLYLFSTISTFGFALMLQSVVFAVVLTLVIFAVLSWTAANEEAVMRTNFGPAYDDYAVSTWRIIPRVSKFRSEQTVTFHVPSLRVNFADALVFLGLIPVAELINWFNATGKWSVWVLY
jgi:protein-S-isoprenylcysteine O-methyltransferase Ste14